MPYCSECGQTTAIEARYCKHCGEPVGGGRSGGWGQHGAGLDTAPRWLGLLAIPALLSYVIGLWLLSFWAYRRGQRDGAGWQTGDEPYQHFRWKVFGWQALGFVPVLGWYAYVHLPALCYKQGLRVAAKHDTASALKFTSVPAFALAWAGTQVLWFPVWASIFVLVAVLAFYYDPDRPAAGADSPAEADIRNEELVRSLPRLPGSVLIENEVWDDLCCSPVERYRLLTRVYASDATLDDVLAFYRQRLTEAGWEDGQEVTGGHGFHKNNIIVFITPVRRAPFESVAAAFEREAGANLDLVSVNSTSSPPSDASVFFAVTVSRRIACLRVDCLRWPTGSQ